MTSTILAAIVVWGSVFLVFLGLLWDKRSRRRYERKRGGWKR